MTPAKAAMSRFMKDFAKSMEDVQVAVYDPNVKHEVVSTGSLALDYALGVGGFVKGRVVELWGPEQTGKSTSLIIAAAEFQRTNPHQAVAWIDVEKTWDWDWAIAHGLDVSEERFTLFRPNNAEDVANIVKKVVNAEDGGKPLFGFSVLDSVGAMIPQVEKDKDAEEVTMGVVAKEVTRMVKIAAADAAPRGHILAIINQVRANLSYGGDITRTGGFALSHVTTHRLKFRRASGSESVFMIGSKTDGTEVQVGQKVVILVEKNKVAPPKRSAQVTFFNQPTEKYGPEVGIDKAYDVFATGKTAGVYGRRGSWYDLPDGSEHNGEAAVLKYLRGPEGEKAMSAIREKTLATRAHEVITDPIKEG